MERIGKELAGWVAAGLIAAGCVGRPERVSVVDGRVIVPESVDIFDPDIWGDNILLEARLLDLIDPDAVEFTLNVNPKGYETRLFIDDPDHELLNGLQLENLDLSRAKEFLGLTLSSEWEVDSLVDLSKIMLDDNSEHHYAIIVSHDDDYNRRLRADLGVPPGFTSQGANQSPLDISVITTTEKLENFGANYGNEALGLVDQDRMRLHVLTAFFTEVFQSLLKPVDGYDGLDDPEKMLPIEVHANSMGILAACAAMGLEYDDYEILTGSGKFLNFSIGGVRYSVRSSSVGPDAYQAVREMFAEMNIVNFAD